MISFMQTVVTSNRSRNDLDHWNRCVCVFTFIGLIIGCCFSGAFFFSRYFFFALRFCPLIIIVFFSFLFSSIFYWRSNHHNFIIENHSEVRRCSLSLCACFFCDLNITVKFYLMPTDCKYLCMVCLPFISSLLFVPIQLWSNHKMY